MEAKEYIKNQLEKLREVSSYKPIETDAEMVDFMYAKLMSKKFRKFSVPEENKKRIKKEIQERVSNKEPLLIQYPFGGYKLWRLEEAPETDWAELFSLIYCARWVKDICSVYKPGIHFVFRFDEIVVKKLNNIPESETEAYLESFKKLLEFIKPYLLPNMNFDIFIERERYKNYEEFEKELEGEIESLRNERKKNPFTMPESEKAAIDLNVKLLTDQDKDPNWREEINLIHFAYYNLQGNKESAHKHYEDEGILVFPFMFSSSNLIAIGTTKNSTAKFWVGVGVLKRRGDSFIETVLSPSQLASSEFTWEDLELEGLDGKNFKKIRIIN